MFYPIRKLYLVMRQDLEIIDASTDWDLEQGSAMSNL
jgi:hypothetical protein